MATETGPDLTFAQQQVEDLMDDTCDVVRPEALTASALASAAEVHTGLRCMIRPENDPGSSDEEFAFDYTASVPASVVGVEEGDVVRVTSSRRDPALVGQAFVVVRVEAKTMLVSRKLRLTRFETVRRDPDDPTGTDPDWTWSP